MDKESISIQIMKYMKEVGKMIKKTVMGYELNPMVISMRVTMKLVKDKEKGR